MSEGYNSHCGVLKWLLCLLCDSWWCNFQLTNVPQQRTLILAWYNVAMKHTGSWLSSSVDRQFIIIIIISTSSYIDFVQVAIQRKADHSIYSVHKRPPLCPPCPGTYSLPTHPSFPPALRKKKKILSLLGLGDKGNWE